MNCRSSSMSTTQAKPYRDAKTSSALHRHLRHNFLLIAKGEGNYLILEDGRRIFDGSGGAAVACIGHGDQRVLDAEFRQMREVSYCATIFYTTKVFEKLCNDLVNSTHGHMGRAYIVNSGMSFSMALILRQVNMARIGGHGGSSETSQTILLRKIAARTATDSLYITESVLSWNYAWCSFHGWTQGSTSEI
jgi:4-aminobutyrate aminotransferase-like enzyme